MSVQDAFLPSDPGIGGAAGADSGGVLPGGGSSAGSGAGAPDSAPYHGALPLWLHNLLNLLTGGGHAIDAFPPVTVDPSGTPHRVPSVIGTDQPGANPAAGLGLGDLWQQITAGAPIVGVYALLALLFLIGVVGLVLSSSPGQAAIGAATGEVGAAAAGVGRAAGRRITRRKAPPKPPPK